MSPFQAWLTFAGALFVLMLARTVLATWDSDPWSRRNAVGRAVVIVLGAAGVVLLVMLIVHLAEAAIAAVIS